jgi:hypothetical protein
MEFRNKDYYRKLRIIMPPERIKDVMDALRDSIKPLVTTAASYKNEVMQMTDVPEGMDKGETIANIMLAIRHLEDAAMRFGKAIQASNGGTSPLGGPNTPESGVPGGVVSR